jgi:hypothetical protein
MSEHERGRDPGTPDHVRIEELLAAHALHSLDGEELREAERILAEHVPECDRCRGIAEAFESLAGELALASSPVRPPDTLLARLRMEIRPRTELVATSKAPRRGAGSWFTAAAALALVGLTAWNATLHARIGDINSRQQRIARVTHLMAQPDARTVPLESDRAEDRVLLGYRETQVALFGSDVAPPAPGKVYRLWVGRSDQFVHVIDFVPEEGLVTLLLRFDARRYDQILITEEPEHSAAARPVGTPRWSAVLTPNVPVKSDPVAA